MYTLRQHCISEPFGIALGNFLDEFRKNPSGIQIEDSILDLSSLSQVEKSIVAATVDAVCTETHIEQPSWVFDNSTYLHKPYFSMNAKGDLRMILIQESPCWFRSRNLFVSNNCIERV